MGLLFKCSHCGHEVAVRYLKVGEQVKCPACGQYGVVPPDAVVADVKQPSMPDIRPGETGAGSSRRQGAESRELPPYIASLGKRFWGYMIDQALVLVPSGIIGYFYASSTEPLESASRFQQAQQFLESGWSALSVLVALLIGVVQAVLLVRRGQTVGKCILRTRIVTMDNKQPAWWRLILVRPLIILAGMARPDLQWTPAAWGVILRWGFRMLAIANAAVLFESKHRAIHDLLAGTQVVDLRRMPGTTAGLQQRLRDQPDRDPGV